MDRILKRREGYEYTSVKVEEEGDVASRLRGANESREISPNQRDSRTEEEEAVAIDAAIEGKRSMAKRKVQRRILLGLVLFAVLLLVGTALNGGSPVVDEEKFQRIKTKVVAFNQKVGTAVKGGYQSLLGSLHSNPSDANGVDSEGEETTSPSPNRLSDADSDKIKALKNDTVIVLKTGSSVLYDRLPIQLLSLQEMLSPSIHLTTWDVDYYGPKFLLYSDANKGVGLFRIQDALANVSAAIRNQTDFQPYFKLQKMLEKGEDPTAKKFEDGWKIDKFKFLYMWQDAYRRHPDAKWYVGFEADGFIFWDNLFEFLQTQDETKESMFGCPNILLRNNEEFVNGGCGYIISGALMRQTFGKNPSFAESWDDEIGKSCCGDAELSTAIRKAASTKLKYDGEIAKMFTGEKPQEILFNGEHWCNPILSFHHLNSVDVQKLFEIHQDLRQGIKGPILYADLFEKLVPEDVRNSFQAPAAATISGNTSSSDGMDDNQSTQNPTREDWEAFGSNDAGVSVGKITQDPVDCQAQCLARKECTTWFWIKPTDDDKDGDCYLLIDAIKIGKPYIGSGIRTSGWIGKHIQRFRSHHVCKRDKM